MTMTVQGSAAKMTIIAFSGGSGHGIMDNSI